ncbi:MAG: hypothetical protein K2L51_07235, partial [Clostridiales bacterium]|nr:hypothetical protein [Clostridiales bacterium]
SYRVYSDGQTRPTYYTDQTRVFDTCILRLKFEKDGVVYDLGVVDDVQSGKQPTVNTGGSRGGCDGGLFADLWALLKRIGRFIRKFWQVVLPIGLAVVIGMVVIGVIEWGFKQK